MWEIQQCTDIKAPLVRDRCSEYVSPFNQEGERGRLTGRTGSDPGEPSGGGGLGSLLTVLALPPVSAHADSESVSLITFQAVVRVKLETHGSHPHSAWTQGVLRVNVRLTQR